MAEWTYDIGPHRISAELSGPVSAVVDVDADGLDVACEQGREYMRESISFRIPIEVLRRLLAALDAPK